MKTKTRPWFCLFLMFALATGLTACGGGKHGGPDPDDDPFSDYVPDPELFAEAVDFSDPDAAVDFEGLLIAKNQLIVLLAEDAPATALDDLLLAVDGAVIGQIVDLGIYQLRVDAEDLNALLQVRDVAAAQPGIEHATFNHEIAKQQAGPEYCYSKDDNHEREDVDRCALRDIGYFQMVPIMEKIKETYNLSEVRVAVIDTGVQKDVGELGIVRILNLNLDFYNIESKNFPTEDADGHGTQVAGIIAADNGNHGVNGIASRVLGHKLQLIAGVKAGLGEYLMLIKRSLNAKARVVNMSYGTNYTSNQIMMAAADNAAYIRVFNSAPQALFVVAAGNENLTTSIFNYSPLGGFGNNLSVGGTAACAPNTRWPSSNMGPSVEIAAPAEHVPVIRYEPSTGINTTPTHDVTYENGTSYAAPIVSSLAAILFSLDPTLTGTEVKNYVLHHVYPGPAETGGGRVMLPIPIEQLVIDFGPPESLKKLLDSDESPGTWDNPGMVINRICGGAQISISGIGTLRFDASEELFSGLQPMGLILQFINDDGDIQVDINSSDPVLNLYQDYLIPSPVSFMYSDQSTDTGGTGTGGSIIFTGCTITDRGANEEPIIIELEGVMEGGLDTQTMPDFTVDHRTFDGTFHSPVAVNSPGEAALTALEENCVNGIEIE